MFNLLLMISQWWFLFCPFYQDPLQYLLLLVSDGKYICNYADSRRGNTGGTLQTRLLVWVTLFLLIQATLISTYTQGPGGVLNLGGGANVSWQGLVDKTLRFITISTKPYSAPGHLLPNFSEENQNQALNL